jgi:hypothetical protein
MLKLKKNCSKSSADFVVALLNDEAEKGLFTEQVSLP